MNKVCNVCKKELPINLFNKHSTTADKRQNQCRICRNAVQRKYRSKNGNSCTIVYEKTKKGFLMRCYRNMSSRVAGIQKKGIEHYLNLELLDKKTYYDWALADLEFNKLFYEWERSGYERKITPSIDRKDSKRGYSLNNIRWVTHSENSRLGAVSRWSNKGKVL